MDWWTLLNDVERSMSFQTELQLYILYRGATKVSIFADIRQDAVPRFARPAQEVSLLAWMKYTRNKSL